jgi:hypothetical protein
MLTELLCRQEPIKLFTQLSKDKAYEVPNELLQNFTSAHAGAFKCHTVTNAG